MSRASIHKNMLNSNYLNNTNNNNYSINTINSNKPPSSLILNNSNIQSSNHYNIKVNVNNLHKMLNDKANKSPLTKNEVNPKESNFIEKNEVQEDKTSNNKMTLKNPERLKVQKTPNNWVKEKMLKLHIENSKQNLSLMNNLNNNINININDNISKNCICNNYLQKNKNNLNKINKINNDCENNPQKNNISTSIILNDNEDFNSENIFLNIQKFMVRKNNNNNLNKNRKNVIKNYNYNNNKLELISSFICGTNAEEKQTKKRDISVSAKNNNSVVKKEKKDHLCNMKDSKMNKHLVNINNIGNKNKLDIENYQSKNLNKIKSKLNLKTSNQNINKNEFSNLVIKNRDHSLIKGKRQIINSNVVSSNSTYNNNNNNSSNNNKTKKVKKKVNHSKIKEEYFDSDDQKIIDLTSEEKALYGDRVPKKYKKIKLLGKGGYSAVWLCVNERGDQVAAKQIVKKALVNNTNNSNNNQNGNMINIANSMNYQIAKNEIEIMTYLKNSISESELLFKPKENTNNNTDNTNANTNNINVSSVINLIDSSEDQNDIWLISKKGGKTLSSLCYKIKGEFLGSERIYSIQKGIFYRKIFENNLQGFKFLLKTLINYISILSSRSIIHNDIKPDNILIETNTDNSIKDIQLIDYGSSYFIDNPTNYVSNTPEYMSPEITNLIEKHLSYGDVLKFFKAISKYPWCVDMWSLAVTMLEIVLCCPLWMSYKCKVVIRNRIVFKTGLLGVKCRDGGKIYSKQMDICRNLKDIVDGCVISDRKQRELFFDLIKKMMDADYTKRISPDEALKHRFFMEEEEDKCEINEDFNEEINDM